MNAAAIAERVLLVLGVGFSWLAAFGLLHLRDTFSRLHCVGLAAAGGGACFVAAVLTDRGAGTLGLKTVLGYAVLLLTGAVGTHACGRALRLRRQRERSLR